MAAGARVDLVEKAIAAGAFGHIQIKESVNRQLRDDPDMAGYTPAGIRSILRDFVRNGGKLTAREEKRQEYFDPDDPWWYRAIIPVDDKQVFPKGLFLEVKLIDDDEDEPWVEIVSAHRQT
jgi:hypothetical protein